MHEDDSCLWIEKRGKQNKPNHLLPQGSQINIEAQYVQGTLNIPTNRILVDGVCWACWVQIWKLTESWEEVSWVLYCFVPFLLLKRHIVEENPCQNFLHQIDNAALQVTATARCKIYQPCPLFGPISRRWKLEFNNWWMSELGTFSCLLSEVRMSEPNTEGGLPISQPVIAQVSRS